MRAAPQLSYLRHLALDLCAARRALGGAAVTFMHSVKVFLIFPKSSP